MREPRLAYVVPTMDRPDDLAKLLASLAAQTVSPDQLIVVDGSGQPVDDVVARSGLAVDYVRELPPSLARQRNAGMARLRSDITVAGYLDDDLVLQPDATERMRAFWAAAGPEVGGASFSIINQPGGNPVLVDRLFLLNSRRPGKVLRSGHASSIPYVTETIETDWLYGGATMWRREVVDAFSYDEWYEGHGYLEDLDYSFRVRGSHRLFVVGDARVHHYSPLPRADRLYVIGQQEILNRLHFTRKIGSFSRPAVAWALTGRLALNVVAALRRRDRHHFRRVRGNLESLRAVVGRRDRSFGGNWK